MSVLATKLAEWNALSAGIHQEHQRGSFEQCAVDGQTLPCDAHRAATALALAVIALDRLTPNTVLLPTRR